MDEVVGVGNSYDGLLVDDSCKLVHSRNTGGEPELILL